MMKTILLFTGVLLLSFKAQAQTPDSSVVIRQIDSLIQLSRAFTGKKDFDKALDINMAAGKLALQRFSSPSASYGKVCFNQGRIMHYRGDFAAAEKWYKESADIRSKAPGIGKAHPDYAWSLNNLSTLYDDLGSYEKAEQLCLEAKKIREKALGKDHPDYASSLNNLAILYREMGHYEKAEQLYLEAKDIRFRVMGKEHPDYAVSLNNLGNLYYTMGHYEKAEPLHGEAKDIREKAFGKEHPDYAASLNNLALIYLQTGQFEKAGQFFIEARDIRLRLLGEEHPLYASNLNNLAILYRNMGAFEKAESLYIKANEIRAAIFGKDHPDYAKGLYFLALFYSGRGNYTKAAPLLVESKNIMAKALGVEHPDYADCLNQLARLYHSTGRIPESSGLFLEMSKLHRLLVNRFVSFASENEITAYLHRFETPLAQFLTFARQHPNEELLRESYNNALFFNGLTLENNRLLTRAVGQSDTLTRNVYEKWQDCHRRLAKRYARPLDDHKKTAEVEAEAEGYEKMLMRSLPVFQQIRKVPTWLDVRNQLKSGEAAIEFLRFPFYDPGIPDSTATQIYSALILRPGWEAPKLVPLCEEKQLDLLLRAHGERKADYVASLYSVSNRGIIEVESPENSLYELIWKPMETALNGVTKAYFSPRGLLHRINLSAIPLNSDSTLADRYHLIELGSTRQLVSQGQTAFIGNEAVLLGGIRFDMDSAAIFAANESLKNADLASRGEIEALPVAPSIRGGQWNYLKWTEREVKALASILSTAKYTSETRTGFEATEEAFKNLGESGSSPRVLHIATHGFFFPDPKTTGKKQEEITSEVGFKVSGNPLVRSGLLLAGANHAWQSGKPFKKGLENGILTAFEISHMNLSNTELVVLSACETGLGDIQGNEGVYGLQRAFKIAGAKYLIMSLWQVPDFQTQELMTTFYTKWLEEKMTIPEAFRSAQQEMRVKYENPYFWAGFVLVE